ncbi:MAG: uroporphyrinogen-III C-methyltransferase, partial [Thermodesulfobacteriota bacterium]
MKNMGVVYLIGAGPGDPGLITVKGKKCLERADVVFYDHLVNTELLNYVKKDAEIIYVGKKKGIREYPQFKINKILIKKSKDGKVIARLKGGDPFVFGRGGEEAEELSNSGIKFEIIPGVSSPSGVPAYAGIPITHRNYTSSYAVVTGHKKSKKEDETIPWEALAKIGSLVFIMGVETLDHNMKKLIEYGKSPETPVAVITWGTLPKQTTLTDTIGNIGRVAKDKKIKPPGIVIVGDVVKLRKKIKWFETKPLFGKKVLITRARKQSNTFVELLQELGAEVMVFPTIEIVPPKNWSELDNAIKGISTYDWLIFTSVNGVHYFFERLRKKNRDLRNLKGIKIAAIGEQTAVAVNKQGLIVDLKPDEYRAEGLIGKFKQIDLTGNRILLPRAKVARNILPKELTRMGSVVNVVTAYETKKPNSKNIKRVENDLKKGLIDVIAFTSSSTVNNFFSIFGRSRKELSDS